MNNLITIIIMFVALGCGKSETKTERVHPDGDQPPLDLPLVGSYEVKVEENTVKMVFLENGKSETWKNGEKKHDETWKISGKEVHVLEDGAENAFVFKIEPNGDLIVIARIKDNKREDYPKEYQLTYKKLKE